MDSLLAYPAIIYDTQCFVYYCLDFLEKIGGVDTALLSDKAKFIQKITGRLISIGKRVVTIQKLYEEIARSNLTASIISDFVEDQNIRKRLGVRATSPVPFAIKLSLMRKLDKKIRGLQSKNWLTIHPFSGSPESVQSIRDFYTSLERDARMIELLRRKGRTVCYPAENDIHLILFSKEKALPIVSNDRDLVDFREDLEQKAFCHKIIPLLTIQTTS